MPGFLRALVLALTCPVVVGFTVVTESPTVQHLPKVLSTLQEDNGISEVGTACALSSRGVSAAKGADLFGVDNTTQAFGTDTGICVVTPKFVSEVGPTVSACGGTIIYHADTDDLSRGEGLFDTLGPAMEYVLSENLSSRSSLIVICSDPAKTRQQLGDAATAVLANLITDKSVAVLDDVFNKIKYVKTADKAMGLLPVSEESSEVRESAEKYLSTMNQQPGSFFFPMSATDLAAARQIGPAARKALNTAVDSVKSTLVDGEAGSKFGEVCEAAMKGALNDLDTSSPSKLASSSVGKKLRDHLKGDMKAELEGLCEEQLDILRQTCFDEFKQNLSKLRISPTLAHDMQQVADKAVSAFAQRSRKMPLDSRPAKRSFQAELREYCADRLLAARASGQFKPVPRKGITIGLHWLLPKPFGNDFRQEPWLVHSTDDLVYIPQDKITDINPEDVAKGDWRNKVVPNPAGSSMIFME